VNRYYGQDRAFAKVNRRLRKFHLRSGMAAIGIGLRRRLLLMAARMQIQRFDVAETAAQASSEQEARGQD